MKLFTHTASAQSGDWTWAAAVWSKVSWGEMRAAPYCTGWRCWARSAGLIADVDPECCNDWTCWLGVLYSLQMLALSVVLLADVGLEYCIDWRYCAIGTNYWTTIVGVSCRAQCFYSVFHRDQLVRFNTGLYQFSSVYVLLTVEIDQKEEEKKTGPSCWTGGLWCFFADVGLYSQWTCWPAALVLAVVFPPLHLHSRVTWASETPSCLPLMKTY